MKMLRLGYFADGPWSHQAFELLNSNSSIEIAFICVRSDTSDYVLKDYCEKYQIPYLSHKNVNSDEFLTRLKSYNCDLFVSMSFNQIMKAPFLSVAPKGVINCHAGKLPFYRGRNILNWALINGEKEFGITVHYVDTGIDTGDIILQKLFPITESDDYGSLLEKAYVGCAKVLYEAVLLFLNGDNVEGKRQSEIHPVGLYCCARKVGDEVIDWNQPSEQVFNFIRAISRPGPCARTYSGGTEIKLVRAELIESAPIYKGIPGSIVGKDENGIIVKTMDSTIRVTDYESPERLHIGKRLSGIR